MDFEKVLKSAAWTEVEVGAVVLGGILGTKFLDDKKIWKEKFESNPEWFDGPREGAPFMIKWSGALKAGGAVVASTYFENPWIKLILIGIAVQGTIQQLRVLTYDKEKGDYRIKKVGAKTATEIDAELAAQAKKYREMMQGPDYLNGPEYVGAEDLGDRYKSQVAGGDDLGDRYKSQVAGIFDEDDDRGMGFGNFESEDGIRAA
jgi:hypothetical protein